MSLIRAAYGALFWCSLRLSIADSPRTLFSRQLSCSSVSLCSGWMPKLVETSSALSLRRVRIRCIGCFKVAEIIGFSPSYTTCQTNTVHPPLFVSLPAGNYLPAPKANRGSRGSLGLARFAGALIATGTDLHLNFCNCGPVHVQPHPLQPCRECILRQATLIPQLAQLRAN